MYKRQILIPSSFAEESQSFENEIAIPDIVIDFSKKNHWYGLDSSTSPYWKIEDGVGKFYLTSGTLSPGERQLESASLDLEKLLGEKIIPLEVNRPQTLFSEQSPEEWWNALEQAIYSLKSETDLSGLKSIGLSGQMHGAVLLDEKGDVLRPAILWNDGRSGKECLELEEAEPELRVITGNLAMPGFTAPKLLWVLKHEPQIFKRIHKVLLPKDYLRYKLSGETISDMSDSAGTLWLDTEKREWSEKMLSATHLSKDQMPTLVEGSEPGAQLSAKLTCGWGLSSSPVIAGGAGDNAAGAIGMGAVEPVSYTPLTLPTNREG